MSCRRRRKHTDADATPAGHFRLRTNQLLSKLGEDHSPVISITPTTCPSHLNAMLKITATGYRPSPSQQPGRRLVAIEAAPRRILERVERLHTHPGTRRNRHRL